MKKININNLLSKIQLRKNIINTIEKYTFIVKTQSYQDFVTYFTKINYQLNSTNFIIIISSKNTNIFIHLLDSIGNELIFYSIGSIGLNKKYNKEIEILQTYLKTILVNFNILKNKSVVLHLLNINYNLNWFINKLRQKLIIISTKQFVNLSFNGCRRKKL